MSATDRSALVELCEGVPCREICDGDEWDHEPLVMTIATAHPLVLRCPICLYEVQVDGGERP